MAMTSQIRTLPDLLALYPRPGERAIRKELPALDRHGRDFIALSPFVVLSTANVDHDLDASPRGGEPGFVKVTEEGGLLVPDWPGNHRLDSLQNILSTGRIGLLFMIPGFDETLRVNGYAKLSVDPVDLQRCANERRAPKLVIRVDVTAAYLHCAKAMLRSRLWADSSRVERSRMPTIGTMINDQTGLQSPPESREAMERRYAADL
jgi:PPOX class probable FMN-dependent enzyme